MVVRKRRTDKKLEFSQSLIRNFRRCEQLYHYRYVEKIKSRRPKIQLIRGTIIGECLNAVVDERHEKDAKPWQQTLEKFRKQYGNLFKEEREEYGDLIGDCEKIVTKYVEHYKNDWMEYLPGKDGKRYELEVRLDLDARSEFVGHIDKMPRDKHGRIWDQDHKTHRNIPDAEARYADIQQVFYVWAAPLSGYPKLNGILWDYLRTKPPAIPELLKNGQLSKRKNIDTDWETYEAEIHKHGLNPADYDDMRELLEPRGNSNYLQRVPLPSPPKELIERVVADARATIEIIHHRRGKPPIRSIDFECKGCEFYRLCQEEYRGVDSSFLRKSEYEINKEPRHDHS